MIVCKWCHEEIRTIKSGDEAWEWCDSCQMAEPGTVEIDEYEIDDGMSKAKAEAELKMERES